MAATEYSSSVTQDHWLQSRISRCVDTKLVHRRGAYNLYPLTQQILPSLNPHPSTNQHDSWLSYLLSNGAVAFVLHTCRRVLAHRMATSWQYE